MGSGFEMTNSFEHHSERARFGPFEVDLQTHELWKFGTRLKLVGQPFEILAMLLSRPGKLVTRDELRNRLWPSDTFVDFNHGLNAAVNKLRESLSDSADDPRYIETLPRRGYRFRADVEWLHNGSPIVPAALPKPVAVIASPSGAVSETSEQPALAPVDPEIVRDSIHPRILLVAGLIGAILVVGVVLPQIFKGHDAKPVAHVMVERTAPLIPVSNTSGPAFSPDGNYVTFFREHSSMADSGIYVTTVGSDQLLQLTNNDDDCCPVWSPDGHWIAFTRQHNQEPLHLSCRLRWRQGREASRGARSAHCPGGVQDILYIDDRAQNRHRRRPREPRRNRLVSGREGDCLFRTLRALPAVSRQLCRSPRHSTAACRRGLGAYIFS